MLLDIQWVNMLAIGITSGVICLTIANSEIFTPIRNLFEMLAENIVGFNWLYDLIRCPYCLAHWICFGLIYLTLSFNRPWPQILCECFICIAISSVVTGLIKKLYDSI